MKIFTKEEAIEYCFDRLSYSELDKKMYHKYREYRRRHLGGEELKDNAINAMLRDFGFEIKCEYFLRDSKE